MGRDFAAAAKADSIIIAAAKKKKIKFSFHHEIGRKNIIRSSQQLDIDDEYYEHRNQSTISLLDITQLEEKEYKDLHRCHASSAPR